MRCFVCFANKPSETCLLKLCFRPPRSVLAGCRCKVGSKRRGLRPVSRLFRARATHLLSKAQNTHAPRKITHPVLPVRASFACPWPCVCTPTPPHTATRTGPPVPTYTPTLADVGSRMHTQVRCVGLTRSPRYAHGKLRVVPRRRLCIRPRTSSRLRHDMHTPPHTQFCAWGQHTSHERQAQGKLTCDFVQDDAGEVTGEFLAGWYVLAPGSMPVLRYVGPRVRRCASRRYAIPWACWTTRRMACGLTCDGRDVGLHTRFVRRCVGVCAHVKN